MMCYCIQPTTKAKLIYVQARMGNFEGLQSIVDNVFVYLFGSYEMFILGVCIFLFI